MDRIRKWWKRELPLDSGIVYVLALALCLGALPVRAAAQDQDQDEPGQQVQPRSDDPALDGPQEGPPPSYQQVPSTLTLPAGTIVTVRVSQFLSSDQNLPGDGFNAELQQPLVVDGWVVARRGQTVLGRVAVAQKAGRVKGTSQLGVELRNLVLVDGQQLSIRTQLQQASAGTSKERDAQAIGTTTGMGTIIGAVAGEGKGAAIGAGAGAAAGIAGVLLTRGRPTVIPPESVLTFQLESPITFSTQRSRPAFRPVTQEDYNNNNPDTLRRRPQRYAVGSPYPPPPYYYGGYNPWGYYYPGSVLFGYGFGRGYGRRGYR